jgi:cell wall-associated NlpC family hydrolase
LDGPKHVKLARLRIATLALIVSLGWMKPQPALTNTRQASVIGEFPIFKPDDSQEFPKLKRTAMHAFKVAYKPRPKMTAKKKPVRQTIHRWSSKTRLVVAIARQYLGVRYVFGGSTPSGFDCSGYTRWVYAKVGVSLPRTARSQAWVGRPDYTPHIGDLVFWNQPATHVGIYVGNGLFIAAPHTGASVRIAPLYGNPYFRRIL